MLGTKVTPISKPQLDKKYRIEVVDHEYIFNRWEEIDYIIYDAFEGAEFNDGYTVARPINYTWTNIVAPYQKGLKHVIALDENDNILGAFFMIPSYKPAGREDCDIGWMFTIKLYPRVFRHSVIHDIVDKVHEVVRNAGYARIITNMGTKAGGRYLCTKHGYIHTPIPEKNNRYTKELLV